MVVDSDAIILSCNAAAAAILDTTQAALVGRSAVDERWQVVDEELRPVPPSRFPVSAVLAGQDEADGAPLAIKLADGSLRWLTVQASALHAPHLAVGAISDRASSDTAGSTPRRDQERGAVIAFTEIAALVESRYALEAERDSLAVATELAGVGHWRIDRNKGELYVSEQLRRMLGHPDIDVTEPEDALLSWVHTDDRARFEQRLQPLLDGQADAVEVSHRLRTVAGARFVHTSIRARRTSQGAPASITGAVLDITEQARLRARATERGRLVDALGRACEIATWSAESPDGPFRSDERYSELFADGDSGVPATVAEFLERVHPRDRVLAASQLDAMAAGDAADLDVRFRLHDGTRYRTVHCIATVVQFDVGPPRIVGLLRRTEGELGDQETARSLPTELIETVLSSMREGVVVTEPDGTIIRVNDAYVTITGYTRDELLGKNPRIVKSGRQNAAFYERMWSSLLEDGFWQGEFINRRKSGATYCAATTIQAQYDALGEIVQFVGVVSDITRLRASETQLEELAQSDALTELANRAAFRRALERALARGRRRGSSLAVLFLNLDYFRQVNDLHGHDVGDAVLVEVANRLTGAVRDSDIVARLGGDEFIVLAESLRGRGEASRLALRCIEAVDQPIEIEGDGQHHVTVSVGIAIAPEDAEDATTLIRIADSAMNVAKREGRSRYAFHEFGRAASDRASHQRQQEFSLALVRDEIVPWYQPQVDLRTGRVAGLEALARWNHPSDGVLAAGRFIHLAESGGVTSQLGRRIAHVAVRDVARLHEAKITPPVVSINVSTNEIAEPSYTSWLVSEMAAAGVEPREIMLEITEQRVVAADDRVVAALDILTRLGIRCSIDDFGTGHSSLIRLKRLPLHQLKIDRSFVRDMTRTEDDRKIIEATIALARSFDLEVVAEGVETAEQADLLRQLGVPIGQGWLYSTALSLQETIEFIKRNEREPEAAD